MGSAVERNRLRRRIRAILHDAARNGEMPSGYYLFGVHRSATTVSVAQLRNEVGALLRGVAALEVR